MSPYVYTVLLLLLSTPIAKAQTISHNTSKAFFVTVHLDTIIGDVAIDHSNKQIQLHTQSKFRLYAFDDIHHLTLYQPNTFTQRVFRRFYHENGTDDLLLEQFCDGPLHLLRSSELYLNGSYEEGIWMPSPDPAANQYYLWDGHDLNRIKNFKRQLFSMCNKTTRAHIEEFLKTHSYSYDDPQHQLLTIQEINNLLNTENSSAHALNVLN